jgi:hypothetical protein
VLAAFTTPSSGGWIMFSCWHVGSRGRLQLIDISPRQAQLSRFLARHSHREILGLRVIDDDSRGRLLGVELVFLIEGDADLLGG